MTSSDREFEGRDLEEALKAASVRLGIAEPELDYEILEQGRRGLFGIGAKSVRIRVMPPVGEIDEPEPRQPEGTKQPARDKTRTRTRSKTRSKTRSRNRSKTKSQSKPATEPRNAAQLEAAVEEVRDTVQQMVDLMGLTVDVEARAGDSGVTLELDGKDRKLLTHKDGELISALQFLLNRMARRAWPGAGRIHLSANGGRKHRDEELVALTREVTQQVSATGKTKRLHPMNAYERRLVHITVRERPELGSRSEGSGYLKRVRIFKNKK